MIMMIGGSPILGKPHLEQTRNKRNSTTWNHYGFDADEGRLLSRSRGQLYEDLPPKSQGPKRVEDLGFGQRLIVQCYNI